MIICGGNGELSQDSLDKINNFTESIIRNNMKQKYIGVKIVEADPMKAGEFNKMKPDGNCQTRNPEDEGYCVYYPQGDGYVSWCPKDVFEEFNFCMEGSDGTLVTKEMVIDFCGDFEASNLDEKTTMVKCETKTGFRQYEVSSCVDPKNYDAEIGAEIAAKRIQDTIWQSLGFVVQWARFGLNKRK